MKRLQLVSRGSIQRMRQAAEQAWHDRDLPKCVELLERASRLDPANIEILMQLGRMYGVCYDYAGAERSFERAIRLSPNKADALTAAAHQSRDFYNTQLTEHFLERAVKEKAVHAETLVRMADVYERLRRSDDTTRLVDQALEIDPSSASALFMRGRVAYRKGQLADAETALNKAINVPDAEIRAKSYYELGAVLDRQERYDDAMAAFLQAKSIVQRGAAPYVDQLRRIRNHLAQMRDGLSADLLQRWFDSGAELQPSHRLCLLGGHPRSGTTLLEQVVDSHPDVVSAEETTVFTDYAYSPLQRRHPIGTPILQILNAASRDDLAAARMSYFKASSQCVSRPLGDHLLVDKNPSLTLTIPALLRVFPEIKLLIALRDPRDVVLSCFMQPFVPIQTGSAGYLSLEGTVEEYGSLMSIWQTLKPLLRNPFLEVRYEDMVENLELVARNTLDFLGIDWDERVLGFDAHARQKVVRSPTYSDVTQKVFKRARGRWRNYEKYLVPHLGQLQPYVTGFGYE